MNNDATTSLKPLIITVSPLINLAYVSAYYLYVYLVNA